jgi:lipoprotein-releasing system permease protein
LAKRYAYTKRSQNFITIISVISTLGIMVGVAALICVLSVFNGFSSVVQGILIKFDPHVRIVASADSNIESTKYLANANELMAQVRSLPDVVSVAAVNREKAVIVHYALPRIAILSGIDEKDVKKVSGLDEAVSAGKMRLDSEGIILGQLLADNMAIIVGDTIEVFSPIGMERILTEPVMPRSKKLIVRGIFGTNNREYDGQNAYASLAVTKDLFDIPEGAATSVEIRLNDIHNSIAVKAELEKILPKEKYTVQTWYDLHGDLYSVMEMERWIAYAILILIVAVASFSIFSALTLTVYEKKRDIGLLLALGAEPGNIRRIYLLQGLLTGVGGVILGSVIGLGIIWAQQEFGFFKLDTSVYIIAALPVELRWTDFVSVSIGAMLLVILATIYPARRAALTAPADALRWE